MKKKTINGVSYLTFDIFDKHSIKHCFSTRCGGVSDGYYESLNLRPFFNNKNSGDKKSDKKENIIENFKRICSAVGFNEHELVFSDQTHNTNIKHVTNLDAGKGFCKESDIKNIDGLITSHQGVVLTTFYADCVPLYFFDTDQRVIALSHAGWKGTLAEIGKITIMEMQKEYGCNPQNIIVGIGPSIGVCCFETDKDVAFLFKSKLPISEKFITKKKNQDGLEKYNIDLWNINKQILIESGIKKENIEISELCTKCNNTLFYSHRLMGTNRGSLAAFLTL